MDFLNLTINKYMTKIGKNKERICDSVLVRRFIHRMYIQNHKTYYLATAVEHIHCIQDILTYW